MFGWLNKRIKFHKKSFRVLWIPVMFIWGLFSNAVTIRDNFFSVQWQQRLATLSILPKWHSYLWVIGTLVIIIVALIEGSYRAAQLPSSSDSEPIPANEVLGADADSTTQQRVNVELTPSQGQSERQCLEVINKGAKQKFHAQCRILERRNDPNPQRRIVLDLNWWNRSEQRIVLGNGESCNLLIAEAGDMSDKDGWVTE
jgi:hypothetical protein